MEKGGNFASNFRSIPEKAKTDMSQVSLDERLISPLVQVISPLQESEPGISSSVKPP